MPQIFLHSIHLNMRRQNLIHIILVGYIQKARISDLASLDANPAGLVIFLVLKCPRDVLGGGVGD